MPFAIFCGESGEESSSSSPTRDSSSPNRLAGNNASALGLIGAPPVSKSISSALGPSGPAIPPSAVPLLILKKAEPEDKVGDGFTGACEKPIPPKAESIPENGGFGEAMLLVNELLCLVRRCFEALRDRSRSSGATGAKAGLVRRAFSHHATLSRAASN